MNLQNLKDELNSKYKHRIELHAHTSPASNCSQITPKHMVDTYKNLEYDVVVITNHFIYQGDVVDKDEYIRAYLHDFEETKKYGAEQGLKILLGAEIRFTEYNNDYLIYGVNGQMLSEIYDLLPLGIENFRKYYPMPNSVFIQAHPKRDRMTEIDTDLLDGVEVFNMHPAQNSRVGMCAAWVKEKGISLITAGSDFHHPNQNHEGVSALKTTYIPTDSFDLAKLIKSRDYLLEIGRNNIVIV